MGEFTSRMHIGPFLLDRFLLGRYLSLLPYRLQNPNHLRNKAANSMIRYSSKTLFQIPKSQFNSTPSLQPNRHFATTTSFNRLIDTFRLPSYAAVLISDKLKITNPDNKTELQDKEKLIHHCFSVFNVLKDFKFSGAQIAKLIRKRRKTLGIKSVEALRARLAFLEEKGFKRKDVAEFIVTNPIVLNRGIESRLMPAWEFLRTCVGTDDNVRMALARWPWLLTANLNTTAQPNVVLLMDHGVSLDAISNLIVSKPRSILCRPERMSRVLMLLKDSGRDPRSKMFLCALIVMVNISEPAWNGKIEALRSVGFTEEDVKFLVKNYPICLACSAKKIISAFDFLLNTMKLDLRLVINKPLILLYGLEGRVRPRLNVIKVLQSKNLVKDKEFVPQLMDVYRGSTLPPL